MSEVGQRLISFRAEGFDTFLNVLHKTYGSAGDAMIYDMSEKYGEALIRTNLPGLPDGMQFRIDALKTLSERFESQGWGRLIMGEIDVERGIVRVQMEDQPFESCNGPEENPSCIFIRGTLAGLIGAVLGKNLRVQNVDCSEKEDKKCWYVYSVS